MSSNRHTVISAIASKDKTTFYTIDGKVISVNQGDPRLPGLLAKCQPFFARKQAVEIDLDDYSMYGEFEKKTNGLVKFFRAAKKVVSSVFESLVPEKTDTENIASTTVSTNQVTNPVLGSTTNPIVEAPVEVKEEPSAVQTDLPKVPEPPKQKIRYDDVKEDLKPVAEAEPLKEDETVVAVIGKVVIPNAEQLKPYIAHALRNNSEKAVVAFLERIAMVIDQRGHSIPDLFNFLEKGDLPLADDGSIIAYKILKKSNEHSGFTYVDCHSKNVHQRVGTFVRVEEKLVDKNRSNECSNGLHVARRGYIGNFSGDVCTMIKMAPEDVIAVPHRDYNKVRVCGYHIIFELPKHVYDVLRSNKPMTSDPEAAAMLEKAIKGDHVGVLEEVWIGGQRGTNLSIKNQIEGSMVREEIKKSKVKAEDLTGTSKNAAAFDDVKANGVDVKELQKTIKAEEAKVADEAKLSPWERYKRILRDKDSVAAQELLDRKKKAKKSWESLGLEKDAGDKLQDVISGFAAAVSDPSPVDEVKAEPVKVTPIEQFTADVKDQKTEPKKKTTSVKGPKNPERNKPTPKPVPEAVVKAATKPTKDDGKPLSIAAQAQDLYLDNKWDELKAFAKSKKKSLSALGFTETEIKEINA